MTKHGTTVLDLIWASLIVCVVIAAWAWVGR